MPADQPVRAGQPRSFGTAVTRWARVGPYFAMFPVEFAMDVVGKYTDVGDKILDPFVGRGSSIFAAGALGRVGCGIEINPVGWVYSSVKLRPAAQAGVLRRLRQIGREARLQQPQDRALPEFFGWAFSPNVLSFLLAARNKLDWKRSIVDRTLMAFILIYLHGRRSSSLSNQMRDSKAMAPDYAVRWWREREMGPPDIDPVEFLEQRINWRYLHGRPKLAGAALLGNTLELLSVPSKKAALRGKFDLLFTSPPYYGVTNYHYDQWLRLWMLGWQPSARRSGGKWQRKFESRTSYKELLESAFCQAARRMRSSAIVYVRTDARDFTLRTTVDALTKAFPEKKLDVLLRPLSSLSQTALYGDRRMKPGEVDLLLTP